MPKVEWHGDRLAAAAQRAVLDAAEKAAEEVKRKAVDRAPLSNEKTAPHQPHGTLRNSAEVNKSGNGYEVSFNTPYAVVMHESENYEPSHSGTGPNYLRGPLLEEEEAYHKAVADALKAIFG